MKMFRLMFDQSLIALWQGDLGLISRAYGDFLRHGRVDSLAGELPHKFAYHILFAQLFPFQVYTLNQKAPA